MIDCVKQLLEIRCIGNPLATYYQVGVGFDRSLQIVLF